MLKTVRTAITSPIGPEGAETPGLLQARSTKDLHAQAVVVDSAAEDSPQSNRPVPPTCPPSPDTARGHTCQVELRPEPSQPLEDAMAELVLSDPGVLPNDRLDVIWQWYEGLTGDQLNRPPTLAQRQAVAEAMRAQRVMPLYLKPRVLRLQVSRAVAEKASSIVQQRCGACETMTTRDGGGGMLVSAAVDVEPWSAQSNPTANKIIKETVNAEMKKRGLLTPWTESPICMSVVSLVPKHSRTSPTKDVDNLVKGLLDSLEGVLYDKDRRIQCLTSRRVDYNGNEGYYLLQARSVYPWDADVVLDDGQPIKRVSGTRIVPSL